MQNPTAGIVRVFKTLITICATFLSLHVWCNNCFGQASINESEIASVLYVSPDGLETNDGTRESPRDLQSVLSEVRNGPATKIVLMDGDYRDYFLLRDGEELLILEAENPGQARISGADIFEWNDEPGIPDVYSINWTIKWGIGGLPFPVFYTDEEDITGRRREILFVNDTRLNPRHVFGLDGEGEASALAVEPEDLLPGEFTVNEDDEKIYFRPFDGQNLDENSIVEASVRSDPANRSLFIVIGRSNLVIRGIAFIRGSGYINIGEALTIKTTGNPPSSELPRDILIENCRFAENNGRGLQIGDARNVSIINSVFEDNGEGGISSGRLYGLLAEDCIFRNNGWRYTFWLTQHTAAGWKHLDYNPLEDSRDLVFRRLQFVDNATQGLWLDYAGDGPFTVDHCLFENNHHRGMFVEYTRSVENLRITDCVFRNNGQVNLQVSSSANIVITDSVFHNVREEANAGNIPQLPNLRVVADKRRLIYDTPPSIRGWIIEGSTIIANGETGSGGTSVNWELNDWGADSADFGTDVLVNTIVSDYNTWYREGFGLDSPEFPGDSSARELSFNEWQDYSTTSEFALDAHSSWEMPDLSSVGNPALRPTGNIEPSAIPDKFDILKDEARVLAVLENDLDADGGKVELILKEFTQPEHGFLNRAGQSLVYTPAAGYTGGDVFRYTLEDASGDTDSTMVALSVSEDVQLPGGADWHVWTDFDGDLLAIPPVDEADVTGFLNHLEAENSEELSGPFAQQISGYLLPPEGGLYEFWISSDGPSVLRLSTDENPANSISIARQPDTNSLYDWSDSPLQRSSNTAFKFGEVWRGELKLIAGRRYYFEITHTAPDGEGHLAVAWRMPSDLSDPISGQPEQIITGEYLLPISGVTPPPETWGGFLVESDMGDLDSGNAMGWINTFYQPWIWSYSLNKFLFIEEPEPGAMGFWAYFPRTE